MAELTKEQLLKDGINEERLFKCVCSHGFFAVWSMSALPLDKEDYDPALSTDYYFSILERPSVPTKNPLRKIQNFFSRIGLAWKVFLNGQFSCDDIMFSQEGMREMVNYLQEKVTQVDTLIEAYHEKKKSESAA